MTADSYADGTAEWWHLSRPSPELLEALASGWLRAAMRVLDLGCGLATDLAYLASLGFQVTGVDLSAEAITRARVMYPDLELLQADVRQLPFEAGRFDYLLDRGCFHYLPVEDRAVYEREASRVLRAGGEFLLRACLRVEGVRNDITEDILRTTFARWTIQSMEPRSISSDTRTLDALVVRLVNSHGVT